MEITLDPRRDRFGRSSTGATIRIGSAGGLLGRDAQRCDLVIDLPHVSRQHARIVHCGEDFFVEDLESADGTALNGQELDARRKVALRDGDVLSIGDRDVMVRAVPWYELAMEQGGRAGTSATQPAHGESPRGELAEAPACVPEPPSSDGPPPPPEVATETADAEPLGETTEGPAPAPDLDLAVALLGAFADGLSMSRDTFAVADAHQARDRLVLWGSVLRRSLEVIRKAMVAQERFRDEYRIPALAMARGHVNPLLSPQIDIASLIDALFAHTHRSVSDPLAALDEVEREFYHHAVAVPRAVDGAVRSVFDSLAPARIAEVAHASGRTLPGPLKKASYWDQYREEFTRQLDRLSEFDNEYRRAVASAYAGARGDNRAPETVR